METIVHINMYNGRFTERTTELYLLLAYKKNKPNKTVNLFVLELFTSGLKLLPNDILLVNFSVVFVFVSLSSFSEALMFRNNFMFHLRWFVHRCVTH